MYSATYLLLEGQDCSAHFCIRDKLGGVFGQSLLTLCAAPSEFDQIGKTSFAKGTSASTHICMSICWTTKTGMVTKNANQGCERVG